MCQQVNQGCHHLNPNEDSIVDLTTHVENNSIQVEHLDVLADTYAKHLTEYQ